MKFYYSISLSSSIWPLENNEVIDIFSYSIDKQSFDIYQSVKIYREEEQIIIEKIKENEEDNKNKPTKDEDKTKLGEIIHKNSKYYYKPNTKQSYYPNFKGDDINNNYELCSFLIYKSDKIPENKNKYRLKEGDVIKLGREWLFIKEIYISNRTKQKLRIKNKEKQRNKNKIFLNNSQTNKELNINEDFNIFEYNDTDEDKNVEIDIINKRNKFITENEEDKKNIKEIILKDEDKSNSIYKDSSKNKNKKIKICRICYLEEFDKINNPLIKPCKCSGSMKYIHYECILHWLKTKIMDKSSRFFSNDYLSVFGLELIECELCKTRLPDYIRHNNEIYSLLNLEKNYDTEKILNNKEKKSKEQKEYIHNYIIFDSVTPQKTDDSKFRFLTKFDKNNILRIGRGLENQLILNDISVSRNHCKLIIDDNEDVILEDNSSRFGSLVLIQDEIEILKGHKLHAQVGTNYLIFTLNKKKGLFSCCNAEEIDNKKTYEKLNTLSIKYNKKNEILDESISIENSDNDEKNKKLIKDEKDNDNKSNDLIIFEIDKINKNKRNKLNINNDLNYNESTLMLKDNKIQEKNNIKCNKNNSINNIREDLREIKKEIINEIKSENIIFSEWDVNKSKIDMENKSDKIEENN